MPPPFPSRRKEWLFAGLLTVVGAASIAVYVIVLRRFPVAVLFLLIGTEIFTLALVYFALVSTWRKVEKSH